MAPSKCPFCRDGYGCGWSRLIHGSLGAYEFASRNRLTIGSSILHTSTVRCAQHTDHAIFVAISRI